VSFGHKPVLLSETMEQLHVRPGGLYVDGTVGPGGHAAEVLRRSAPNGRLLALDRDEEALFLARDNLACFGERVVFMHADFRELPGILAERRVDGVLLDLGVSSCQLADPRRGFGFSIDGPLDMRLDRSQRETAERVVNRMRERDLADVIHRFGEDPSARRIARAIVAARRRRRITTTAELASIVRHAAARPRPRRRGLDPATRTFQALRIHVNRELEDLESILSALARHLAPGGRLVVISFHSLEDRQVKRAFRELSGCGCRLTSRKPIRPSEAERIANPRCRSARLRAIEREEAA
jgi:16S rRNA (cytosine1402-N4)-methyltransferase